MKMFISFMLMMMSSMMFFMKHPLSMGLFILIQTLLMCMMSGMMIKTYWFSYILFLTFLGGLLVLFIYVSSIASNELFKISMKMKMMLIMFIMLAITMKYYMMNYNVIWMNLNNNMPEINNFFNLIFINNENKINLNKLYNNQTFMLMLMMMIYLFISLIAIVKITNIFYGPLRMK